MAAQLPPGPRLPLPVQAILWQFLFPQYSRWCHARYGDLFTVRLPLWGGRIVNVCDPVTIRTLFTDGGQLTRAGEAYTVLEPILGRHSVELLDGPAHIRQRQLISPSLHGRRLEGYADLIRSTTAEEVERWPVGRAFPLWPTFQAVSLEVILRGVLGIARDERLARFRRLTRRVLDLNGLIPMAIVIGELRRDFGPWRPWSRFLRERTALFEAIMEEVRERRAAPGDGGRTDMLSALLAARDTDGRPLSDDEVRDEVMTMIVAGHQTTAAALSWFFDLVLHAPAPLARLEAEVARGETGYLDAAIQESMRLRPVIPLVARRLRRPLEVQGYPLPAGVVVTPNVYLSHRRPESYPEPDDFRPERFLEKAGDPYRWLPFGGGARRCIGASLATQELRVIVHEVLRRVRLRAASPRLEGVRLRAVTLVPPRGVRVVVTGRR